VLTNRRCRRALERPAHAGAQARARMLAPSLDSPLTRSFSSPARGLERDGISSPVAVEEDFDGLSKGALYKRKDFLDVEEDAKLHPERTYYYRKVVDLDKAIEQCNRKLAESPRNVKALTTRAGCFMKKKLFAKAADDFSAVLAVTPEDVSVLYSRGAAYDKLGQTTDAIVSVQPRGWSRVAVLRVSCCSWNVRTGVNSCISCH